ncbi:hypothetical protein [Metamycoplasma hyosynoviae]|uniref:hypothetical protein n=1 Tax=Metamycoplasma hyosynoviae TaxID=29559 RepID=UPI00049FC64B|nr:hypothetical protein [Metamycoplasma hyosynoviae]KDE45131.1 hypothetical protein NPL2_01735 [Metamycoplasma hyosynoviae]
MNKKTKVLLLSSLSTVGILPLPLLAARCGEGEVKKELVDQLQTEIQLLSNLNNNLLNVAPQIKFHEQSDSDSISKLANNTKSEIESLRSKIQHDKKLKKVTYNTWKKEVQQVRSNINLIKKTIKDRLFFFDEFYIKNKVYWETITTTFKDNIEQTKFEQKYSEYNKVLVTFLDNENWNDDELNKIQSKFKLFDDIYQLTIAKVIEPSKQIVNNYMNDTFWKDTVKQEKDSISQKLLDTASAVFENSKDKASDYFFGNYFIFKHIDENLKFIKELLEAEIAEKSKPISEKYEAVKTKATAKLGNTILSEDDEKKLKESSTTEEEKKNLYQKFINEVIKKLTEKELAETSGVLKTLFSDNPDPAENVFKGLPQNYKDLVNKKNSSKNSIYVDYVDNAINKAKKAIEVPGTTLEYAFKVKLEIIDFYLLIKNLGWLNSYDALKTITNELKVKLAGAEDDEDIEKLNLKIKDNLQKAEELLNSPLSGNEALDEQRKVLENIKNHQKIKNFINANEIRFALKQAEEKAVHNVETRLDSYGNQLVAQSTSPNEMHNAFQTLLESQKKTIRSLFTQFTNAIIGLQLKSEDSKVMEEALLGFTELINTMTTVILEGAFELKDDTSSGFDFLSKAIQRKIKKITAALSDLIDKFAPVVEKTYSALFYSILENEVLIKNIKKECLVEFAQWNIDYYVDKIYGNDKKNPPVKSVIPQVKEALEKIQSLDISDPKKMLENELAPVLIIWNNLVKEQDREGFKIFEKYYDHTTADKLFKEYYVPENQKKVKLFQDAIWSLGAPIIDLGTGYKTFYNVSVKLLK